MKKAVKFTALTVGTVFAAYGLFCAVLDVIAFQKDEGLLPVPGSPQWRDMLTNLAARERQFTAEKTEAAIKEPEGGIDDYGDGGRYQEPTG